MTTTTFSMIPLKSQEAVRTPGSNPSTGSYSDLEAFNELVLEHQDAVYRQALWILKDEAAAEDATQEAFLRAYRNLRSFNGGPFRPWVLKIATNYCLDQLRGAKKHPTISLEIRDEYDDEIESPLWLKDTGASVEELIERCETQRRIADCIRKLPPEYRVAVILVDLQDLDYQEAAAVMGINLGTFKSRLSRARVQLQKWLSQERQAPARERMPRQMNYAYA